MSNLTFLKKLKLSAVLELSPTTFCTQERNLPKGSSAEFSNEWMEYWKNSLADSGITDIGPIYPGSWHVKISDLTFEHLKLILPKIIQEYETIEDLTELNELDELTALYGGVALNSSKGTVLIEPQCCSDLSSYSNWIDIANDQGEQWKELWIGHPWISAIYKSPNIIFSDYHESDKSNEKWAVDPKELLDELENVKLELQQFSEILEVVLNQWIPSNHAVKVAKILSGLSKH